MLLIGCLNLMQAIRLTLSPFTSRGDCPPLQCCRVEEGGLFTNSERSFGMAAWIAVSTWARFNCNWRVIRLYIVLNKEIPQEQRVEASGAEADCVVPRRQIKEHELAIRVGLGHAAIGIHATQQSYINSFNSTAQLLIRP